VKKIIIVALFMLLLISKSESKSITNQTKIVSSTNSTNFNLKFENPAAVENNKGGGYFSLIIKTIFILGIFIVALYYIFKFISKKQGLNFQNLNIIKVVSSLPIGTNRFLLLIELEGRYFLIGSTDSSINLIKEISDKDLISRIELKKNQEVPKTNTVTFKDFLHDVMGPALKNFVSKDEKKFIQKEKGRLRKLNDILKKK